MTKKGSKSKTNGKSGSSYAGNSMRLFPTARPPVGPSKCAIIPNARLGQNLEAKKLVFLETMTLAPPALQIKTMKIRIFSPHHLAHYAELCLQPSPLSLRFTNEITYFSDSQP